MQQLPTKHREFLPTQPRTLLVVGDELLVLLLVVAVDELAAKPVELLPFGYRLICVDDMPTLGLRDAEIEPQH